MTDLLAYDAADEPAALSPSGDAPAAVPSGQEDSVPEAAGPVLVAPDLFAGRLAVPAKFLDAASGALRLDLLVKSYLELERHLSRQVAVPAADAPAEAWGRVWRAMGVPESGAGYQISCDHGLFGADPAVNDRLSAAGFTPPQAQLVYDLAAEHLVPMVRDLLAEMAAEREIERLVAHFGGPERWREVSRQLLAWGRANLPPPALEALASSADGVLALERMMQGGEPAVSAAAAAAGGPSGNGLKRMMRDPRYWKQRDPAFVAEVTEGFRRLYSGG